VDGDGFEIGLFQFIASLCLLRAIFYSRFVLLWRFSYLVFVAETRIAGRRPDDNSHWHRIQKANELTGSSDPCE
jgi:hypothetical protein